MDRNDPKGDQMGPDHPPSSPARPGDEAPAGTPGSGEDLCRVCAGTGHVDAGRECPNCGGTGIVITGIGGG